MGTYILGPELNYEEEIKFSFSLGPKLTLFKLQTEKNFIQGMYRTRTLQALQICINFILIEGPLKCRTSLRQSFQRINL